MKRGSRSIGQEHNHNTDQGDFKEPKTGWLYNIVPTTIESTDPRNKPSKSGLELFFLQMDGSTFSCVVDFPPYFYIGLDSRREPALETFLRNKFGEKIAETKIIDKEDLELPNHLAGLTHRFLFVSFHNIRDLMDIRTFLRQYIQQKSTESSEDILHLYSLPGDNSASSDPINVSATSSSETTEDPKSGSEDSLKLVNASVLSNIVELRESTVPYYERFCIDRNIRCACWFRVEQDENFSTQLVPLPEIQDRPQTVVLAYDIETCKAPLKFPNAEYDPIMMISYMLDNKGFLIVNREVVSEDIQPFEYTPKEEYIGKFDIFNEPNEKALILRFFSHIKLVRPQIFVTFNGDFFDWPYVEKRAEFHDISMFDEIGVKATSNGEYTSKYAPHLDCFCWVKRDSYLPQGSQGLKKVTKAKLGYDPLELDPEDMTPFAKSKPQVLASYSVSDAVATYYLYMKYVHPFIFSLCTIIPLNPDDVLRKGSGTLCEALLMVEAFQKNVVFPDKKLSVLEDFYRGHLLQAGTYIGGHVEALRSGVFRSDIPTLFEMDPTAFQMLIDCIDQMLEFTITHEGHLSLDDITNYDEVKQKIIGELEALRDRPTRTENPMIYHLDVSAMYPNIILTNRLQPSAMVSDSNCASCDFFEPNASCQRKMGWVWRGEMFPATQSEYRQIVTQLNSEYVNVSYTEEEYTKLLKNKSTISYGSGSDSRSFVNSNHNKFGFGFGAKNKGGNYGTKNNNGNFGNSRNSNTGGTSGGGQYNPIQRNFQEAYNAEFISFDTTNARQTPLEFHPGGHSEFDVQPGKLPGTVIVNQPFQDLDIQQQMPFILNRLKLFSQKVYKKQTVKVIKKRVNTVCQRENSFYVDTVRLFRDRRYEYKKMLKTFQRKLKEAKTLDDTILAKDRIVLYDSLQLAHKCILNSFYGYVMRKGARWYSMEMAGIVTHTGGEIIKMARRLVERVGFGLELDTDGIWCCLPKSFPENFTFTTNRIDKPKYEFSYPCVMLNYNVWTNFTNDQYSTLEPNGSYSIRSENSIEFEVDGPYLAMILPASQEEGRKLKKRYAVFNEDHSLAELKGFEIKRRGELQLVKIFQSQVFQAFLRGTTLQECYDAVGTIANRWLDVLYTRGTQVTSDYIIDLLSENRVMSRPLADYEGQKSTSITCAKRLAMFLGSQMVASSGLAVSYIISREPKSAPTSERAIPIAIWNTDTKTKERWICTWCNNPDIDSFDIRSILDWDYYITRLGAAIQKIITIPAALQHIDNPVPRCEHPPWVLKLISDRTVKKQKPIDSYFAKLQSKPVIGDGSGTDDSKTQGGKLFKDKLDDFDTNDFIEDDIERNNIEVDGQMILNTTPVPILAGSDDIDDSTSKSNTRTGELNRRKFFFKDWLKRSKSKWSSMYPASNTHIYGFNSNVQSTLNQLEKFGIKVNLSTMPDDAISNNPKLPDNTNIKTESQSESHINPMDSNLFVPPLDDPKKPEHQPTVFSNMVQTELEQKAILLAHTWHILKISPTHNPGSFDILLWIPKHGTFNVNISVPRKVYLHSWYPLPADSPLAELAPNVVFKTLPHGIPRIELREMNIPEITWKKNSPQFQQLFNSLGIQGVYESKSPLFFKAEVKIGATISVQPRSHASIIFSRRFGEFEIDDIIREPASASYLPFDTCINSGYNSFHSSKHITRAMLNKEQLPPWKHYAIFHITIRNQTMIAVYERDTQVCTLFVTNSRWPNISILQDALSLESVASVAKSESRRFFDLEQQDKTKSKRKRTKKKTVKTDRVGSTNKNNNNNNQNALHLSSSPTLLDNNNNNQLNTGDESYSNLFQRVDSSDTDSSENDDSEEDASNFHNQEDDQFLIQLFDENMDNDINDIKNDSNSIHSTNYTNQNGIVEELPSSQPLFSNKSTFIVRRYATVNLLISSFVSFCNSKFTLDSGSKDSNPCMIGYSSNSQTFFPSILDWNNLPTWKLPWYPIDSWNKFSEENIHWSVISSLWLCSTIKLFDKAWEQSLSLARYANIPIGNIGSIDVHPLDITLARKLDEFDHVLWASTSKFPDIGLTPSQEILPQDDPYKKYLSISNPGLYLNVVCTVKVSHLFLQALLLNVSSTPSSTNPPINLNPDEQRSAILFNHNISSTMTIFQEIVKCLGTDILENRGSEAPQMLLDSLAGYIQNHKSLLFDEMVHTEVMKTTIRLFRGLLGELQLLGCKIIGANIHSITFETPKESVPIAQAFIRQAVRQIKRKHHFSWIELTPTMYFDTLLFLNSKNFCGAAYLDFPPLFPKKSSHNQAIHTQTQTQSFGSGSGSGSTQNKGVVSGEEYNLEFSTPTLYPQWDILRFLPVETHEYFTKLFEQFVSELYAYKTKEIEWKSRSKRLSPDVEESDISENVQPPHSPNDRNRNANDTKTNKTNNEFNSDNDRGFTKPLIDKRFENRLDNETLLTIANHLISKDFASVVYDSCEEIRSKFRNSELASDSVALQYTIYICHILGSCEELSLTVDAIKNNLLRLLSVPPYSQESLFVDPYASHSILTHTCLFCLSSFELDPLIDPLTCHICNTPIDMIELEKKMLFLFDQNITRHFGNSLSLAASTQLRTIALSHWGKQTGPSVNYTSFKPESSLVGFQNKFIYYCKVARKFNFSILAETIQSLFVS